MSKGYEAISRHPTPQDPPSYLIETALSADYPCVIFVGIKDNSAPLRRGVLLAANMDGLNRILVCLKAQGETMMAEGIEAAVAMTLPKEVH